MVLRPGKEKEAEAIFIKWGLDFAIIGKTTDTLRFVIKQHGEVMADLPIKELGDEAPLYDRPYAETPKRPVIDAATVSSPLSNKDALLRLIGSPDFASKRWVWEQYDHLILGNTVQAPGGDAAVIRIGDGPRGLALTCDVTPRYCDADPFEGGKQAVAEAYRNLVAVGATPRALTDNLNFGNPERADAMGQLVYCIRGLGEACKALDFPVVSGNVSLYNETNGRGILPTPTIGGVGVIDDVTKAMTLAFKADDQVIVLIGDTKGWLGSSAWLATLLGREEGAPPPVDLVAEKKTGAFVSSLISSGTITACHDLSDGGLAIGLAEMALAGGRGAQIDKLPAGLPAHAALFGEDQARYVVTTSDRTHADALCAFAAKEGVSAFVIGRTGGHQLTLPGESPISLDELKRAHEDWLPAFMAGDR